MGIEYCGDIEPNYVIDGADESRDLDVKSLGLSIDTVYEYGSDLEAEETPNTVFPGNGMLFAQEVL